MVVLACGSTGQARSFYVSPDGADNNAGTKAKPFLTVQKAADVMVAGDVCIVRGGTYRETVRLKKSGRKGTPICFVAAEGETVIFDGTELVKGRWSVYKDKIYKTKVDREFDQLFVDGEMMVEARWPNMRFPQQLWERSCWARAGEGSRYGKMVDPKLAETGIDWTGAVAMLNAAHQFFTWTRPVQEHSRGSDTFTYKRNLSGITHFAEKTGPWEDDRYYLFGKLEALDAPCEWFLDRQSKMLYLWAPDGKSPASYKVQAKLRDYAFDISDRDYIEISGFEFFGTTIRFSNCNRCLVENCRLWFPVFAREYTDPSVKKAPAETYISGNYNTVRRCHIAYPSTNGLVMVGSYNTTEDNLIHDVCWGGSLRYVGLSLGAGEDKAGGCVARHNTLFNAGNAVLNYRGQAYIIEYNHVYNGGLACKDVALIYTGQPSCAGSIVRYNWVHGCRAEGMHAGGRLQGGLGIRGDDQTRRLTVHHNVVWDCGRDGIIVKGDNNRVYNNTVIDIGTQEHPGNYINLHTMSEPEKWWRNQFPLLKVQNAHSEIFNNAARTITADNNGKTFPEGKNVGNNFKGSFLKLVNPRNFDFRPRPGSPLIDAGRIIPGFTDGYRGKAPDIGAYEYGGERWLAGITWAEENKAKN